MKKNIAIILAGGTGNRFGTLIPKQFIKIAGKTIIEHTIEKFEQNQLIDEICIVVKKEWKYKVEDIVLQGDFAKTKKIINGGKQRHDSSLSAINAYKQESKTNKINFIFHDAVRPLVSDRIIEECIENLNYYNATDVAIPSTDTIIETKDELIVSIPNRANMMQGQTPQCFTYETISKAYKIAMTDLKLEATDDCGIVKKYLPKENIKIVKGSVDNIKITYTQDIFTADKIFQIQKQELGKVYSNNIYTDFFSGKSIVIFGGSYGIGKQIKQDLIGFGADVYAYSRTMGDIDVSRLTDVQEALKQAYTKSGKIDFVVNTASILIKEPLVNTKYSSILDIVNINYIGAVNIIKESIPYLKVTKGGILNFTSSSYTRGRENYSLYSSTKAAIVNLTQAVAEELKKDDININCINPARTKTPMRIANFGLEDDSTLLNTSEVSISSLNTLMSNITGQTIDVKLKDTDA